MMKQNIARFILNQKLKKDTFDNQSFASAFKKVNTLLILMPEDEKDFKYSIDVLTYLESLKKEMSIVTYDYRVSLLPFQFRGTAIAHGIKEINKIDLPSKKFISTLVKKKFDAILDLNRKEQLFYIYLSGVINARIRIGFVKKLANRAYNLQVTNGETNPKISYENLLSCLKML